MQTIDETLIQKVIYILMPLLLVLSLSCNEKIADNPPGNKQPSTYLWLFPDSTVGIGISRQRLHWWGEDPDGRICGYMVAIGVFSRDPTGLPNPDTLRYTWVTNNDTLMAFPLDTLFRKYTVFVRSVDNTFRGLQPGSVVRFSSGFYWDKNDNGLDGSDSLLLTMPGAIDPRGAVLTFPVRNTPPEVGFALNPNDLNVVMKQPDTTFAAATFSFKGSDFDGDNTLVGYRIALNDTSTASRWLSLTLRDTIVTLVAPRLRSDSATVTVDVDVYSGKFLGRRLVGRLPGLRLDAQNKFFVEAKDVAGEFSQAGVMPSGTDRWYVRKPRGRLLLVSDYAKSDSLLAVSRYLRSLADVPGGNFTQVDQLNIGRGVSSDQKKNGRVGVLVPPFIDPALVHTFLLYDYILWYSEPNGVPSLGVAQFTVFPYLQNGGKVIFSTAFETTADPRGALKDFAPIDSVSSVDLSTTRPPPPPAVPGDNRIPNNYALVSDSSDATNIYPNLAFGLDPAGGGFHSIFMRDIYRRSDARVIYRLQIDSRTPRRYSAIDPDTRDSLHLKGLDTLRPKVAMLDGQRRIFFIGVPLHLLDNTTNGEGLTAFFRKVFVNQFSPYQRVNRRKF